MKAYLTDRNIRRLFVLATFLGLLYAFRHLFVLLVFFVVFERSIGLCADYLSRFTRLKFKWSVLLTLVAFFGAAGGAIWFGISKLRAALPHLEHDAVSVMDTIRHSAIYAKVRDSGIVSPENFLEKAKEHATDVARFIYALAKEALYVFIALVFSIVFLLEREDLDVWREKMKADSVPRILLRFMGHVTDAIAITLKLQVIVAVVSTLITLPVLIALQLPGIPALLAMQFVCGLVPIVGGVVSGAVLMVLAYVQKGPVGLVVFIVSTFILHKIEGYYLTPRLTAKHVQLPSFIIVVSLVLFEHVFELIGLFLSFPCLYVAAKIREGWIDPEVDLQDDEETSARLRGALPKFTGLKLKVNVLRDLAKWRAGKAKPGESPPAPVVAEPFVKDEPETK